MDGIWDYHPSGVTYTFHRRMKDFVRNESAFKGWVIIGAQDGSFEYNVEGITGEASFGDLVICRPDVSFWRRVKTCLTYHVLEFHWHDDDGVRQEIEDALPMGKISLQDVERLSWNYATLREMLHQMDKLSVRRKEHILQDILQLYYTQTFAPPKPKATEVRDELMNRAALEIRNHGCEDINLKALADSLGLSPVQFTRRFRAALHMTPSEYLATIRMHKARALLLETDLTLQEIAEQCGYVRGIYLSRVFAEKMRMSPGHFRKTHRV